MHTLTITSSINNIIKDEGFFLNSEQELAFEELDKIANKRLGQGYKPYIDGIIGYYLPNGNNVILRENSL